MLGRRVSIFDGVPAGELAAALAGVPRRRFAPGDVLIEEGEQRPREVFVIEAGTVEVLAAGARGEPHLLNHAGPGATMGEMALITGEPATATVRAASDVTVLVVGEGTFHGLATTHPNVYLNLGVLLAERLAQTNRRAVQARTGRVTVVETAGAPPLAGYALTASVAWHARRPVLHVVIADDAHDHLRRLADAAAEDGDVPAAVREAPGERARLLVASPRGAFAPDALARTLDELAGRYEHIVVEARGAQAPAGARRVRVFDAGANGRPRKRPVDGECGLSALESPEADRLGDGLLPGEGPAGRALGRLAREIAGLRVGLALGAGAIKGYAHAGVLQALATLGVPVDYIAGTSIGSAVAALYASGVGPDRIAGHLDEVGGAAFRPRLPRSSLLSSDGVREGLRRIAGDARIEDMAVPLAVVTADLLTHREVIFRRGRVWPAVLASMSIPGIYPPVRMGGALLVDGGILNPVPTDVVAAMGADVVIAVKLASRPEPPDAEARVAVPTVIQAIARSVEVMQTRITSYTAATATVLLEPEFESGEGWGLRHFSAGRRFIPLGGETVHAALPRLAEALPWLREGAGQGDVAASGASDAAASSIA